MGLDILQSVWPEWHIEEKIGEGSYGKVYKASRECMGFTSYCAIKVLTIPQSEDELESVKIEGMDQTASRTYFQEIVRDLINEIKIMESLKGTQNIVSIEDFKVIEEENGTRWVILIRMELLTPLIRYLSDKSLQETDVLKLGIDICGALELCSQRGIIHRDIKPENIFISDLGYFKLGDFGIGKQLEKTVSAQTRKGTVNYMAPEVNNGGSYDSRADMYSLGLVLYKLMNNNRMPFIDAYKQLVPYREKIDANMRRLSGEPLPDPVNAGKAFTSVIQKACAYHMEDRYRSVAEFKEDMQTLLIKSMSRGASAIHEPTAFEKEITNYTSADNAGGPVSAVGINNTESISPPRKSRVSLENTTVPPEYDRSVLRGDPAQPSTFTNAPYTRPQHSKKRKSFLKVMLGIAAVLLCGVVGIFFFLEYENKNNKQEDDPFAAISQAKTGDPVEFGTYEQNNPGVKDPIQWIVIDADDEKLLLLSEKCLDCKKYDDNTNKGGSITWEQSSIRSWLNDEFYTDAFSAEEKDRIILSEVDNSDNTSAVDGQITLDRVFFLSIGESEKYLLRSNKLNIYIRAYATNYAVAQGSILGGDNEHFTCPRIWVESTPEWPKRVEYV